MMFVMMSIIFFLSDYYFHYGLDRNICITFVTKKKDRMQILVFIGKKEIKFYLFVVMLSFKGNFGMA